MAVIRLGGSMKNILEIKRAERQEIEKIREERRYQDAIRFGELSQKHQDRAFSQVFTFSISIGTLAVLVMYYAVESKEPLYCGAILAFFSFAILVCSMLQLIEAFHITGQMSDPWDERNSLATKLEKRSLIYFKVSIGLLFAGMFVIFLCKVSLYSKILALYQCYCNLIS